MKRAKGVAKEFAAEYGPVEMTDELYSVGTVVPQQKGSAVLLNVVSKERFYYKERVVRKTDRVHWRWTQCKLLEAFADMDIELAVYLQMRPREVRAKQRSTGRGEGGARSIPKVTATTGGPSVTFGVPGPAGELADPNCALAATRVGSGIPYSGPHRHFISEMHKRFLDLYVESSDEERAILVDLLAKLCKAPSNLSNNNIWTEKLRLNK
ncbi:Hypothetical predicted protein [Cloeon dipterum]|uniref:Uncharacterized protein n=1 Tax=Cloeon dipterum TaxID=197152 RepID=A0A8S1E213_9INSE|nr:Hypothetical predicted protein [Cloeon dipterum]